ncbi:hypothetical protein CANINC_002729 [Pichia inconspicua]|uniref:Sm domain-containing protein n=1 Tax=Pichia inconspicua TaxID=52247 RepID=A0A4T0X0H4_9ASCO|nr:hypothetical protein CANINC_002729 [[Candida] inconspicua]
MSSGKSPVEVPKLEDEQTLNSSAAENMTLPLELIDQCIGKKVRAYLRYHQIYEGTLVGFDDLVNLVLDDVVEISSEETKKEAPIKRMLLSSRALTMIAPID